MKRAGLLVKTNKGKGIVPKNINWQNANVLVYLVDDEMNPKLDEHGKAIKHVLPRNSVEIVKLIEND